MISFRINNRAYNALLAHTKRYEIRAHSNKVAALKIGQEIIFENTATHKKLRAEIQEITHHNTIKELLHMHGTQHTLSSTNNIQEGITSIHNIPGYTERIKRGGVYAIKLQHVEEI